MSVPWATPKEQVVSGLGTDPAKGLSGKDAAERLSRFGPNRLVQERVITFWGVFREEVTEPMILLLLVVGVFYGVWGKLSDTITIFAVIVALVFAEVFTEFRAKRSITALRRLSPATTPVLRDGAYVSIPAWQVVRGDVIPLEAGDKVPADGRVIESFGLQVDESPLTGESAPVNKEDGALAESTVLPDRTNMVFAGTTVTAGRGRAVVTATGMETELGRITGLVLEAKEPRTPLQTAMRQLAGLLVWVAVSLSVIIPIIGIIRGQNYKDMILTGLSLSFATIPEEMPIIITMVLGVGALALSRRHVLIRRLRAAETLGGVTVIVTDKTGTITENRMSVAELAAGETITRMPASGLRPAETDLLRAGVLTSHIKVAGDGRYTGDPVEVALLEGARSAGLSPEDIHSGSSLVREFSFDNRRKLMSMVYREGGGLSVFAKGAPEMILARCVGAEGGQALAESMARDGMRVIALAGKKVTGSSEIDQAGAESGLTFLGLVGLLDPPRASVAQAIQATKEAGIRTVMVSGDLPLTVQKVATEVGIDGARPMLTGAEMAGLPEAELQERVKDISVFARINPEQKLAIVRSLQAGGEVVAVTGDGINDAPALRSADIGVAMGEKGTEAAREAAGMVLTDDSFSSIVDGVREGRKIYDNLRKGVRYYLSVKIALVLSFIVPLALSLPFPFAPIQIVLLELFMDLAASATFVAEPIERDVMRRPPRPPKQRFIDRRMLTGIGIGAVSLSAAVLFNYLFATYAGWGELPARSVAFGTWLIGHVMLALEMRSEREPLARLGLFTNPLMLAWAGAAILFFVVITMVPATRDALKVTTLDGRGWLLAFGVPLVTVFWQEIYKLARHGK